MAIEHPLSRAVCACSLFSRPVSPWVVIDIDTSIITGSPAVGQAAAIGFGVCVPVPRPPCGTTPPVSGPEEISITIMPWSVTRFR